MSTITKKEKKFSFRSLVFNDAAKTETSDETAKSTTTIPNYQQQPISNGVGVIIPDIKTDLEKVLNASNFPGEDYLEFRDAVRGMTAVGIDNTTAMKGAFATLSTRGLTKEKAIQTGHEYINILKGEGEKFLTVISQKIEEKVSKPKNEIITISQDNIALGKKIEEITKQINDNNETITKKKMEIAEQESLIERTKTNYEFTLGACVKEIEDDLSKIQTII